MAEKLNKKQTIFIIISLLTYSGGVYLSNNIWVMLLFATSLITMGWVYTLRDKNGI